MSNHEINSFWNKKNFCHHVIGLAVLKKKSHYKDVHKQIPIGQTRPRGQPKKTSSALTRLLEKQVGRPRKPQ